MNEAQKIPFDAEALIDSVETVHAALKADSKLTLRTTHLTLPQPPCELSAEDIAALRQALNVSQPVFARLLNVSTVTAASWEKGRRKPSGPALKLLHLARKHPETLLALDV